MKFAANFTPKTYFILAGSVFAGGLGICYMTHSSNGEQQRALEVLKKDLRDEKQVQKELEESKLKVVEIERKLQHLEQGVPGFAYNATLLKELETYGVKNKVTILQVKPVMAAPSLKQEGEKKKPYEEQDIQVKARGTYDDAQRFISALKAFPKVIAIRTLSLSPKLDVGQDESKIPTLDIDIELRAFLFKDRAKPIKSGGHEAGTPTAMKKIKRGVSNES
jgi:Tfp pilus assembly protein PilO